MKTTILFSLIIFLNSLGLAQTNAPEVTNVTFSQRTDGSFIADIYYDLNDADGDTMEVSLQVSDDNGTSWSFTCNDINGDVGADILSGTGKHIIWDFSTEHPQIFGDQFRMKINATEQLITGTVTDIDGNTYQTVKIGNQWWMAENLKVTHYNNGDNIPHVTNNNTWASLLTGAYCNYNNDINNVATYGRLYNWYAVDDSRNIAPAGWHVPTDDEWKQMEMYLGMSQASANAIGFRGTDEGGKMKTTGTIQGGDGLWNYPNVGATNSSGFSAFPGGFRKHDGTFYLMGGNAVLWSSTEYSSIDAWYRVLYYSYSLVVRTNYYKQSGFSVRCVRD